MKRLLGWAVLLGLLVFAVSYVSAHWSNGSSFGCASTGSAIAHADDGDCPPDITAAESDRTWAADRYTTIKHSRITTGLFYSVDGIEHAFVSGEDAAADRANQILRNLGVAFPRRATVHPAAAHVETKAATRMRDTDVTAGVLVINNPHGVCGADDVTSAYGCARILPTMLRAHATLVVWWPGPHGMMSLRFSGGGSA